MNGYHYLKAMHRGLAVDEKRNKKNIFFIWKKFNLDLPNLMWNQVKVKPPASHNLILLDNIFFDTLSPLPTGKSQPRKTTLQLPLVR